MSSVILVEDSKNEKVGSAVVTYSSLITCPTSCSLKNNGCYVTVAVKDAPIMNDATMDDAIEVGMDKASDKLMTTGANPSTAGLVINDA